MSRFGIPALAPAPTHLFRDDGDAASTRLKWLGTAGFVLTTPGRTVAIDPFVTRPSMWTTLTRPLVPDEELISRLIPEADDVLIGHAHYDHVLDGPTVCLQTGARFIGSPSACNVARAAGVDEAAIVATRGREEIPCGDHVRARGIPAAHGRVYGVVPLQGTIDEPPAWPPRNRSLRCGQVLNWLVRHSPADGPALTVLHIDSAEYFADELRDVRADIVCLCAIGRNYRPRYLEEIVELTRPRWIVPCHWDWLFTPFDAPPRQLPGVDLEGFVREIERVGVEPVVLPFGGTFALG